VLPQKGNVLVCGIGEAPAIEGRFRESSFHLPDQSTPQFMFRQHDPDRASLLRQTAADQQREQSFFLLVMVATVGKLPKEPD
jgi:hypothetical protein